MASGPFYSRQLSPQWMLRRKSLPGDEAGSFKRIVSTGNLRGEGQEQFIQAMLGEKISHQLRSTLDQNNVTLEAVN